MMELDRLIRLLRDDGMLADDCCVQTSTKSESSR